MEQVASGLADHHDGTAVGPAVFRRVSVDVQLELLHGVDDRIESHLAGLGLQNADSVVQVLVGARPAAVDARQQRPTARQRDSRGERHEGNEIAPIEGQSFQLRLDDVITHGAVSRFEQRGLSVHIHRLRGLAQFQFHIEPDLIADAQYDALLPVGAEAGLPDRQHILSGGQPEQMILSAVVGQDIEADAGGLILGGHSGFGRGEVLRILNGARQFGLAGLAEARQGEGCELGESGNPRVHRHVL